MYVSFIFDIIALTHDNIAIKFRAIVYHFCGFIRIVISAKAT